MSNKKDTRILAKDFILFHQIPKRELQLSLVIFLLSLFLIRFKAFININSAFLGGYEHDAGLYIWLVRSNVQRILELSTSLFDTNAFFPYGKSLAFSDNFLLPSIIALPFLKLGAPLVLVYNGLILLAEYLNGYLVYYISQKLTGKFWPALIAGLTFMSCSYLTTNLGHPQLQFFFFIPIGFYCFLWFLGTLRIEIATLLGLVILACAATTVYYAIFLCLMLATLVGGVVLLRPNYLKARDFIVLGAGLLLGMLPATMLILPYLKVKAAFGERHLYEAYYFSANLSSYFSAGNLNFLYHGLSRLSHPEGNLFCGFGIYILGFFGIKRLFEAKPLRLNSYAFVIFFSLASLTSLFSRSPLYFIAPIFLWLSLVSFALLLSKIGKLERKLGFEIMTNRGLIAMIALVALIFFTVSFGPGGNPEKGQWAIGPFSLVYWLLPGLDAVRAVARFGVVVIFCLSLISAFAISHLSESRKIGTGSLALILATLLLENINTTYPLEGRITRPAAFSILDTLPNKEDIAIVLPYAGELDESGNIKSWTNFARLNVNAMQWTAESEKRIVNGYSGIKTKLMRDLPRELRNFPDKRSIRALSQIAGLRYIVYLPRYAPEFDEKQFRKNIADFSAVLRLPGIDSEGNYIIELIGGVEIDTDFRIVVPPLPGKRVALNFELLSPLTNKDAQEEVMLLDENGLLVSEIKVPQSGQWEGFTVQLPAVNEPVRTRRYSFKFGGSTKISIRKVKFQPWSNP